MNKELIDEYVSVTFDLVKSLRKQAEAVISYNAEVGQYEISRLRLGIELIKTKRKLDLLESYKENGNEPDLFTIEEIINDETAKFETEYQEMKKFIDMSNELLQNGEDIDEQEINKIDELFVGLIYKFNPVLYSLKTPEADQLFEQMKTAYINYDLDSLIEYNELDKTDELNPNYEMMEEELPKMRNDKKKIYEKTPVKYAVGDGEYDFDEVIKYVKSEIDLIDQQTKFFNEKIIEFFPNDGFES